MSQIRRAAVAGQFYDGDTARLIQDVDSLLANVDSHNSASRPKAIVAPHAGYVYSGPVAAEVYARLPEDGEPIRRVVLLGPSHRVGFRGIATSSAHSFATPLGNIPLDRGAIDRLSALPGVLERDDAHALEHSLEVHLPFLQRCLGEFALVPLVVGDAAPEQVAAVIESLWGGPETLIVISSDLSHYLPYSEAREKDLATAARIEALQPELSGDQACGCRPLNGLLTVLKRRGLSMKRVDIRNSGDTAGTRDRVVGYGAWIVEDPGTDRKTSETGGSGTAASRAPTLGLAQRQQLLQLAREAILSGLHKQNLDIQLTRYHADLQAHRGSFVTLNHEGRLRGCIGSLTPTRPLLVDVANNALAAAFKDARFQPLTESEYPAIEIHISVLSPARPLAIQTREALLDYLQPGVHGLILEEGQHRATYLPSVWEKLPDADRFVSELRAKAGLPREGWSAETRVSVYTTEEFG